MRRFVTWLGTATLLASGLIGIAGPAPAASSVLYVAQGGSDTGDCTSAASPCATITYAAKQAVSGDTIEVSGTIDDNVDLLDGINLTITGAQAPASSPAVIDGQGNGTVIDIIGGAVHLDALTITGGGGGGVYGEEADLTITRSTITGNQVTHGGSGAGISVDRGSLLLEDSTDAGNHAYSTEQDDGAIGGSGGGIYVDGVSADIVDSTIADNTAAAGGGASIFGGTVTVSGSVLAGNTDDAGASNCAGHPNSDSYTLSDDGTCGLSGTGSKNSVTGLDLGSLAGNGGPTQTLLPGKDSTAAGVIPTGTSGAGVTLCGGGALDQRGLPRPASGETACTAGAVEAVPGTAPTFTSADPADFAVGSAGSFTIKTSKAVPPAEITESGDLDGLTFTDNGDGTATLSGTPTHADTYSLLLTAANGVSPAATQTLTLKVAKGAQAITFTPLPARATVGGTAALSATGGASGNPVSFTAQPPSGGSCSITGSTLSFDRAGTCVVEADQAGDDDYDAAPAVTQQVRVQTVASTVSMSTSPAAGVYGQPVTADATVSEADSSGAAGTVQFTVDGIDAGAPVPLGSGRASTRLGVLHPGPHVIGARFVPTDPTRYAPSEGSTTLAVTPAATTTTVTVRASSLTATVTPVAPGAGVPTGTVDFTVDGAPIGIATLSGGTATLDYRVPTDKTHEVAAAYAGDTDFTGSSTSTSRHDPAITAHLHSAHSKSRYGWYRSPVTISFSCVTHGAALTTPCPRPITLAHNGAGQSITRTIVATDGGSATAVASGIDIDRTPPNLRLTGVHRGATYPGTAPRTRCLAHDGLSGVASCTLARHSVRHAAWRTVRYRATATDRAGNTRTLHGSYRVLTTYLRGAPWRHAAFGVHPGHTYTLVVTDARRRPVYIDAAPAPHRPHGRDHAFHHIGKHHWVLGVTFTTDMAHHRLWNIGIEIGHHLRVLRVRI